jgi:hypothetical protein
MSEGSLPVFVETQPTISVRRGHVYVRGDATFVWTEADFRTFLNRGMAALAKVDATREVVPIGRGRCKAHS